MLDTAGASMEKGGSTQQGSIKPHEVDWHHMGLLLTFQQPQVEKEFIAYAHQTWMRIDAMTYTAAIFPSVAKIISFSSPGLVPMLLHHFLVLVFGMGIPLGLYNLTRNRSSWYLRSRSALMPWLKLFIAAGQAAVTSTQDPSDLWVPGAKGFMLRGLARTSVVPSIVVSLTLPLPFKQHVFLQAIMSVASLTWLPKLIRSCETRENLRTAMGCVGQGTEGVLKWLTLYGLPPDGPIYPKEYPCWMVGLFYSVVLEFFTPVYVMYVLEYVFRVNYLQSKVCHLAGSESTLLKVGHVLMATVFFLVACQFVWFKIMPMLRLL